jgi:methylated-DNA-protein-cysteine methyltransferase related protein
LARLRAEGVLADGDRVDLRRYRWSDAVAAQPSDDQPGLFD